MARAAQPRDRRVPQQTSGFVKHTTFSKACEYWASGAWGVLAEIPFTSPLSVLEKVGLCRVQLKRICLVSNQAGVFANNVLERVSSEYWGRPIDPVVLVCGGPDGGGGPKPLHA